MPSPGIPVVPSVGPPLAAWSSLADYDAVPGNLVYSGWARSIQNAFTYTISSITKANPAVVTTSAAHGLSSDNFVEISGATGDWAGINGTQKITVLSTTTFSIPVDTSAYAGTFNGVVVTRSPRTGAACWAIQKSYYDGSNQFTRSAWASGSVGDQFIWDNRATLAYS